MIRSELSVMLKWWPHSSVFSWGTVPKISAGKNKKYAGSAFFIFFACSFSRCSPNNILILNYLKKNFSVEWLLWSLANGDVQESIEIFSIVTTSLVSNVTYFSPSNSNFTHRYDIQTPNELSLHIHLWISWPVRVCLETLANLMKIM